MNSTFKKFNVYIFRQGQQKKGRPDGSRDRRKTTERRGAEEEITGSARGTSLFTSDDDNALIWNYLQRQMKTALFNCIRKWLWKTQPEKQKLLS